MVIFLIIAWQGSWSSYGAVDNYVDWRGYDGKLMGIIIDSTEHEDYGFSYPITYQCHFTSGLSNLMGYKKYHIDSSWIQLQERDTNDFFNAVEAMEFLLDKMRGTKNNKEFINNMNN